MSADSSEPGSRNSLVAGRTGTRLNVGRPQVRWDVGVTVARESIAVRTRSAQGGASRSIGSIVSDAMQSAREFIMRANAAFQNTV